MLMFGEEYNIVRHFPEYFLDYREMLDPAIRWTDRLQSSSGEWSGNICDFYFRVYNKIIMDVKKPKKLVLENPGYIRTGKIQMRKGGESDPRNKSLMKMFNLINIGERSGSGVPNIFNTWEDEGWKEPVIEERFDPDRTILTLEFVEKQVRKASEENKRRKQAKKTSEENKQRKQAKKTSKENKQRKQAVILQKYMSISHNMEKLRQMKLPIILG